MTLLPIWLDIAFLGLRHKTCIKKICSIMMTPSRVLQASLLYLSQNLWIYVSFNSHFHITLKFRTASYILFNLLFFLLYKFLKKLNNFFFAVWVTPLCVALLANSLRENNWRDSMDPTHQPTSPVNCTNAFFSVFDSFYSTVQHNKLNRDHSMKFNKEKRHLFNN